MAQGGAYLYQGLASMGRQIADTRLRDMLQQEKKAEEQKEKATETKRLRNALAVMGVRSAAELESASHGELVGIAEGYTAKAKLGAFTMQQQESQARLQAMEDARPYLQRKQELDIQGIEREQQAAQQAAPYLQRKQELDIQGIEREQQAAGALSQVFQQAGTGTMTIPWPGGPRGFEAGIQVPAPRPLTYQSLLDEFAKNPKALQTDAGKAIALQALGQEGKEQLGGIEFIISPTGAVIAREKKTGQIIYDPVSRAEADANQNRFKVAPMEDRLGRLKGWSVTGSFSNQEEAESWADKQNKTMLGGKPETEPEAPPNDIKLRQVNKVYQTPKGPMRWTGIDWKKP